MCTILCDGTNVTILSTQKAFHIDKVVCSFTLEQICDVIRQNESEFAIILIFLDL